MNFDKTTTAEIPLIRIVDDEERMRESLAFMLKHEGFECCVYPTAESFLKGDTPSRPGCLLLDVQMDGMTGLELQEEMIRRGITLRLFFFLHTATLIWRWMPCAAGHVRLFKKLPIERGCCRRLSTPWLNLVVP